MRHHFNKVRLPQEKLDTRRDASWETLESGREHRNEVLRALKAAMVDLQMVRATYGTGADQDPEFLDEFIAPLWDYLRDSLTRQDLLRWLVDWAHQSSQQESERAVRRMFNELDHLDRPEIESS